MSQNKKTWKREVALVMLTYLFYLGYVGNETILEIVIWPFMLYIGAAYGMEWASKQTTLTTQRYD